MDYDKNKEDVNKKLLFWVNVWLFSFIVMNIIMWVFWIIVVRVFGIVVFDVDIVC